MLGTDARLGETLGGVLWSRAAVFAVRVAVVEEVAADAGGVSGATAAVDDEARALCVSAATLTLPLPINFILEDMRPSCVAGGCTCSCTDAPRLRSSCSWVVAADGTKGDTDAEQEEEEEDDGRTREVSATAAGESGGADEEGVTECELEPVSQLPVDATKAQVSRSSCFCRAVLIMERRLLPSRLSESCAKRATPSVGSLWRRRASLPEEVSGCSLRSLSKSTRFSWASSVW
jgi:hypothetical protein